MVVASSNVVRDGYQALFGAMDAFHVLEPADDGTSALARLAAERPELIILGGSVEIDDANLIFSTIRRRGGITRCLAICSNEAQARDMCVYGADAAVVEGISPTDLVSEVKQIAMDIRREGQ